MKSLTQIIGDGLDASVDGRGFGKEHADAFALANAAPALRDASHKLLEILRSQPKGPQHDAMIVLSDLLAALPCGSNPAAPELPTFTFWCQEASGEGTIYIGVLQAADVEAAKIAGVQECCDEWDSGPEGQPTYTPEDIHLLGIAAGDVEILEWNDLDA